jgi:hypothetical protein
MFNYGPTEFPVKTDAAQARAAIQTYLDHLTAAELIVLSRLAKSKRQANDDDWDVAFAAQCFFIPNKPKNAAIAELSRNVRQRIIGLYVSPLKRQAFTKALQPAIMTASKDEFLQLLGGLASSQQYRMQVLDLSMID